MFDMRITYIVKLHKNIWASIGVTVFWHVWYSQNFLCVFLKVFSVRLSNEIYICVLCILHNNTGVYDSTTTYMIYEKHIQTKIYACVFYVIIHIYT